MLVTDKKCPKCEGTMHMGGTLGEWWHKCEKCGHTETHKQ